jgi:hypothetical protein
VKFFWRSRVERRYSFVTVCRNIRVLFNFQPPATPDEVHAAALQYVRKVSGTTKPSQQNEALFQESIERIAAITAELIDGLVTQAPPKDRQEEAAKARERWQKRDARIRGA